MIYKRVKGIANNRDALTHMIKRIFFFLACILFISSFNFSSSFASTSDVVGLESGMQYYIKNVGSGRYLDVNNGNSSAGTNVWTFPFNGTPAQKWTLSYVNGNVYRLYSGVTSNMVLRITNNNAEIGPYDSSLNNQRFVFIRVNASGYEGTYYIKNGSSYLSYNPSDNNAILSSDSGSYSLWSLELVFKGTADFFSFYYQNGTIFFFPTYFDTTQAVNTFSSSCSDMGYSDYHLCNKTAINGYQGLKTDQIFVFNGHGLSPGGTPQAGILFNNSSGGDNGRIVASHYLISDPSKERAIDNLNDNRLASLRCAIYMGCCTGLTHSCYNLVEETYSKGAHFVLGTTRDINTNESKIWLEKFFAKTNTSATIGECVAYANSFFGNNAFVTFLGDIHAKLK